MDYVGNKAWRGGASEDWIGEFSRLISSHSGTARVAIDLADNPDLACTICGWLCKRDKFAMGCPSCGEVFFVNWEGEDEQTY